MRHTRSVKKNKKMRRTHRNKRHQKLWNQKGCSRRSCKRGGGCGCGMPWNGGGGASQMGGGPGCALCQMGGGGVRQKGGYHLKPLPPALVGTPWTPQISGWPGVAGIDGVTNYYSLNKYIPNDPQTQVMSERAGSLFLGNYTGGKKRSKSKSKSKTKKRGGGLFPQDLVNLGSTLQYGLGSAYNSINGYSQPVNPLPYKDQLVRQM